LNPKFFRNGIVMLFLVVGTAALLFTWINTTNETTPIGYSQFLANVEAGQVSSVVQATVSPSSRRPRRPTPSSCRRPDAGLQ
jgi:hypothetical protein